MCTDCLGNEIIKYCGAHSISKNNDPKNGVFTFEIAMTKEHNKVYYNFYIIRNKFFDAAEKGMIVASCLTKDFETREEAIEYLCNRVLNTVYLDIWESNFIRDEMRVIC